MSVSYHSSCVIGVRLEKLWTVKKEKTSVTKYNENTGQPYQQEVTKERHFWCDKEIEEPDDVYDLVKEQCPGLDLHTSGEGNDRIVGICLGQCEPGDVKSLDGQTVSKTWTDVNERLKKSANTENGVQLWVIAYVAC